MRNAVQRLQRRGTASPHVQGETGFGDCPGHRQTLIAQPDDPDHGSALRRWCLTHALSMRTKHIMR
ncbi:hypothetical protein STBA_03010 [Streptomyces sp. MP131-18]|nr:hypothetical protein STBA_03010 [Streptomyces sp. MP131-18]